MPPLSNKLPRSERDYFHETGCRFFLPVHGKIIKPESELQRYFIMFYGVQTLFGKSGVQFATVHFILFLKQ